MTLIKFRSAGKIANGQEEPRDRAKDEDPKLLHNGVPDAPEIETVPAFKSHVALRQLRHPVGFQSQRRALRGKQSRRVHRKPLKNTRSEERRVGKEWRIQSLVS